ncbi:beta family protein [Roseibium aggregatum]|uniref:beta family protein n=1 Tax=Roseibium aggregatum TaxID=187304 RepID=UPI003A96D74A
MVYRYVPIVRTKAGEADALGNLSQVAKARIFPVIRMTNAVPATFQTKMIRQVVDMPIALDGANNFDATSSVAAFVALFNGLGNGGLPVIPAIPFGADQAYVATASGLLNSFAAGLVLQCSLADLPGIQNWASQTQGWNLGEVDLIIDVGGVGEHNPAQYANYVSHTINQANLANHPWRSVALHLWSAPRDHGSLSYGRNMVQRKDWLTWQGVYPNVPFELDFSDSGHVHPSLEEVPGYAMANATVSIRYTIDDAWIIQKGVATTGPNGIDMGTQYREHAQTLVADPDFDQIPGCWGDDRIRMYAAAPAGGSAGGRPQWAAILLNRHISLVADRLP